MKINVLGVYPVEEAREPCYLLEVLIEEFDGELQMVEFTQEIPGLPTDSWQVPWEEYVLRPEGASGEPAPFPGPVKISGGQRVAFFFHYLDTSRPVLTPAGPAALPEITDRPERLAFIKYEAPD